MEGIELLTKAADELAQLDPALLSDDQLGQILVEWHRQEARLAASRARCIGAFDLRGAYRADGSKTAAAWLARHTNSSVGASRAQVRLARRLRHMPLTRAALAAGEIDERHAEVLAGLAGSPRLVVADAFGEAESDLVEYATTLAFDQFVTSVRYWESLVDEDGTEDQAASDLAARHLHVSETFRGNYRIDGQLDAVGGTEVATELRRIERQLFETDWAEAKAIHGDNTLLEHLARTAGQRRADALREMARRSAADPPDAQEPRPLFVVHLGDETLRRLCELASGTMVTPGQLVPLITEADLERIVYAGRSRTITDLGTRSRFFTGPLRRAILLRDRRCQTPGCDTPAEDCEVDHVLPHSKGGLTTQDNGKAQCGTHNRHKADTHPPQPEPEPEPGPEPFDTG